MDAYVDQDTSPYSVWLSQRSGLWDSPCDPRRALIGPTAQLNPFCLVHFLPGASLLFYPLPLPLLFSLSLSFSCLRLTSFSFYLLSLFLLYPFSPISCKSLAGLSLSLLSNPSIYLSLLLIDYATHTIDHFSIPKIAVDPLLDRLPPIPICR